jgi:choline dehydrogenase
VIMDALVQAAQQAGFPYTPDFNGAQQEGVGYFQTTTRNGQRWSAARAYLQPARSRANLRVVTDAQASRVIVTDGRATGVEYHTSAGSAVAHARGEVIISGGTFNSPHLLQLSGIGPADHLQSHGITPIVDRPEVGENLGDHFCVSMSWRSRGVRSVNDLRNSRLKAWLAGLQYVLFHRGPLAVNGIPGGIFFRTDPALERPNMQINMCLWSAAGMYGNQAVPHPFPGITANVVHLNPQCGGRVRLRSPDPMAKPLVCHSFLNAPQDLDAMIQAISTMRTIFAQPAITPYIVEEIAPGPGCENEADIEAFIRAAGGPNIHAVGTCRMGGDPASVVDPELRVRGVAGLRVADCSIMPFVPAGNTNAPAIMVGEKASQMILAAA